MTGWIRDSRLWGGLVATTLLGVASAATESPWEDEIFSLRALDSMSGYRFIPAYFLWLRLGGTISEDFFFLRLWSLAPFLVGLVLAGRVVVACGGSASEAVGAAKR